MTRQKIKCTPGFTLIELMVTIGLTVILTSMLVLYNRTGERQLSLFAERAKILGVITQAKALSVQTLAEANSPCGYGVYINPASKEYLLFRNGADKDSCRAIKDQVIINQQQYTPNPPGAPRDTVVGNVHTLSNGVRFKAGVPMTILFIPPDPTTLFDPSTAVNANGELTVTVETDDSQAMPATITINDFGQITF